MAVTDDGGVKFWSEFKRLGGVQALGYPVSRRFQWKGFTVQAMRDPTLRTGVDSWELGSGLPTEADTHSLIPG